MIELKNISKSFFQGETKINVLNEVHLFVKKSEICSIVGPSGSGKTTLLSIMAGLEKPDSGNIVINGQEISQLNERDLTNFRAKNLGFVFQNFNLIEHLNALENVQVPLEILGRKDSKSPAIELLKNVGLEKRFNHLPNQLSGGECQRVAIARAFAGKPEIILADEPSGNLDQETGKKIIDYLFSTAREYQTSMIIITHDLNLAKKCDRIFLIQDGKLKETTDV